MFGALIKPVATTSVPEAFVYLPVPPVTRTMIVLGRNVTLPLKTIVPSGRLATPCILAVFWLVKGIVPESVPTRSFTFFPNCATPFTSTSLNRIQSPLLTLLASRWWVCTSVETDVTLIVTVFVWLAAVVGGVRVGGG